MRKDDAAALAAAKWTGDKSPDGTYRSYDGYGVYNGRRKYWVAEPCYACWKYGGVHTELGWYPRLNDLKLSKGAEIANKIGWNQVIRKVFPIMPYWGHMRKRRDFLLKADTTQLHLLEVNFRWRILRSAHEEPSYITSCARILQHFPELPPWVIMGLATLGNFRPDGAITPAVVTKHRTFGHAGADCAFSLMRCFQHIQKHKGRLLVGRLHRDIPEKNYSYNGVADTTERHPQLRVDITDELKRHLYAVNSYGGLGDFNAPLLFAMAKKVGTLTTRKPYGALDLEAKSFKKYLPKANEDQQHRRLY